MILITGGAGYIGSHCVLNFLAAGYEVVIFDNLEVGHIETVEKLKKYGDVKFCEGDLKNPQDLDKVFAENEIDAVIHFAAYALVEESVIHPAKYYRNNVLGTLNLLDAMVKHNVMKIVFSSTCATYGEPNYIPIDESHSQVPVNPYGMTKLMAERIMDDFDKAYGLKSIRLRYFNVAGADEQGRVGEWHETETHLIPNIIKSTMGEGRVFKMFGTDYDTSDGTCVRDYVNVEDLAEAHRLAYLYLLKENKTDVFNLGTEQGSSVKEVFDVCKKVLGREIPLEVCARRAGDPAALYANSQKAQNLLGWKPARSLETSVKTAYEWEKILSEK